MRHTYIALINASPLQLLVNDPDLVALPDDRAGGDGQAGGFGDGDNAETLPSSLLRRSSLLQCPARGESTFLFALRMVALLSRLLTFLMMKVRHLTIMTLLTLLVMTTMLTMSVHVIGRGTASKAGMSTSASFVQCAHSEENNGGSKISG